MISRGKVMIVVLGFGVLGIILLVIGGISLGKAIHAQKTYQPVTAEIIGFSASGPYVSYYVDGKEYERELNFSSSSMKLGDRLELLYDPADPYHVRGTGFLGALGWALPEFMGIAFLFSSLLASRLLRRT